MYIRRFVVLIVALLTACGGSKDLPQKPQITMFPTSIGFGSENGFGVYIGTAPERDFEIINGGLQDLILTSATLTGDSAFRINGPLSMRITGNKKTFVQVIFTPTDAKSYSGTVTIASNAENAPSATVALQGVGIRPSTDGG